MPRLMTFRGALRLFGRIDKFTCECPRCAQLIVVHGGPAGQIRRAEVRRRRPSRGQALMYNPLTQRLTCPQCRRTFGVGLLLYPVKAQSPATQPYDTRPTYRQLLELRQMMTGFFVDKPLSGSDSVNLAIEQECTCKDLFGRGSDGCPVHGWDDPPSLDTAELGPPVGGEEEDH